MAVEIVWVRVQEHMQIVNGMDGDAQVEDGADVHQVRGWLSLTELELEQMNAHGCEEGDA